MADPDKVFRDPEFVAVFPMWTLAHGTPQVLPRDAHLFEVLKSKLGRAILLFTDSDLADRYAKKQGMVNELIVPVENAEDLVVFLEWMADVGITHVAVDAGEGNAPVLPIEDVLKPARRAAEGMDDAG